MILRKLKEKDAPLILSWMKDPTVNCFFRFDPDRVTLESQRAFIRAAQDQAVNAHFACADDNDEYLGTVSLKHIDPVSRNAEYAVGFRQEAHGVGAARFATRELLRYAFEERGLERVYLSVMDTNPRAARFYEKAGFVPEGVSRKHFFALGSYHDMKNYAILREEYEALPPCPPPTPLEARRAKENRK